MNSATVLIIEDDPAILFGLRDNFERAGHTVKTAVEGHLGLDLARTLKPDLIILDLMLPGLDGLRICKEVRRAKLDMPIIMLTALGQEEQIIHGLNVGADDYVTKPFSIHELLARAASFLRRRRKDRADLVSIGACQYDRTSRQLTRAGTPLELTPKELGLLEFFLDHPHRALTREQILDAVWGSDVFVTERSVDRAMTLLRQQIEENPARPKFIRTVLKVGYRFENGE